MSDHGNMDDEMLEFVYIYICLGTICENRSDLTVKSGSGVPALGP